MPSFPRSKIAAQDRLPFAEKVAYGLGGPVEHTATTIPNQNVMPVFNIGLGMDPVALGLILALWRGWDAFADPVMGNFSDNARTRWGRRRPFIVLGAVLTGLTMPLIWWMPHALGETARFAWLLVTGLIFYTCFSFWSMPYYSLQLELTPDYDERTNITAYRAFFQQIFLIFSGWVLALAGLSYFSHLPGGKPDLAQGMRYISLLLALLTIVLGILPGLFVRERYYQKEASRQPKQKLWSSIKTTLSTRPFLWVILIILCKAMGSGLVGGMNFYLNAYYVCRGDLLLAAKIQGVGASLLILPNLAAIPLCTWLASHFGKRVLLYLTCLVGIAGTLSVYFFYDPGHPWRQLVPSFFLSIISTGLWLIAPSMQADIADYDELQTGQRREGSFAAVFSWSVKASFTVAIGLSGVLLAATGFNAHLEHQSDAVLANLKAFFIWVPIASFLLCLFAVSRYELTRERMGEIRRQLEARRGSI